MRNIPVSKEVSNIIKREVIKRNKKKNPGEPKYTKQILTEEIILYWEKVKKEKSK